MECERLARYRCGDLVIEVCRGDITRVECDAVVNPANSLMIMGGGVAGALRRAAGEEVEREARRRAPVPVGKAVSTGAGRLEPRIRYIIHAPTMERPAMRTTQSKVKAAMAAALREAERLGVECLAVPALGAGVGGLSAEESMEAMLQALDEALTEGVKVPKRMLFVAYTAGDVRQFLRAVSRARMRSCKIEPVDAEGETAES